MKTITVNVSEPVYRAHLQHAKCYARDTSEFIREAMDAYRDRLMRPRQTIRNLPPISLGKVLRPLAPDDDLQEEMDHSSNAREYAVSGCFSVICPLSPPAAHLPAPS